MSNGGGKEGGKGERKPPSSTCADKREREWIDEF